jgi:hypothetical protein
MLKFSPFQRIKSRFQRILFGRARDVKLRVRAGALDGVLRRSRPGALPRQPRRAAATDLPERRLVHDGTALCGGPFRASVPQVLPVPGRRLRGAGTRRQRRPRRCLHQTLPRRSHHQPKVKNIEDLVSA